jgi:hypothetical protein
MRKLLMLPALLITPTVLAMTLVSGCKNTLRTPKKPDAWAESGAVRSGQTLVWSDIEKAALKCAGPLLQSAWKQLFPLTAGDPNSSENAGVSWGEVRSRSSTRGVSVAALGLEISVEGFAKISVTDAIDGPSPNSLAVFSVTHGGEVRNLEFGPKLFPRLVALFSPETVGRRHDPGAVGEMDVVVDLHFSEPSQKEVEIKIAPPLEGVASTVNLEIGEYAKCLREGLKIGPPV